LAGYSGTPLVKKLGIKAGHRVAVVDAPEGFEALLEGLPQGVRIEHALPEGPEADVAICFVTTAAALAARIHRAKAALRPDGGLWISWPKKSSALRTDLTEEVVRVVGIAAGLVDNKVCAIDETWSGLRLVYRLKDRPR